MAAENCNIQPGETLAIWGAGPVDLFAIRSAFLRGAARVISIDTVPEGLALAEAAGAITSDFKHDVYEKIQDLTHGHGADACIDTVGTEGDVTASADWILDRVKVAPLWARTDHMCCARQFIAAGISARSPSSAYMAGSWIKFRWVPRSIAAHHSAIHHPHLLLIQLANGCFLQRCGKHNMVRHRVT